MGLTLSGTADTAGDATVFTQRIINAVDGICKCGPASACSTCVDADQTTTGESALIKKYIRHTEAHEAGHAMSLRAVSSTDIGEHYPSGTNVLLDSSVYYVQTTNKQTKVTTNKFYIGSGYYTGTMYTPNDVAGAKLK